MGYDHIEGSARRVLNISRAYALLKKMAVDDSTVNMYAVYIEVWWETHLRRCNLFCLASAMRLIDAISQLYATQFYLHRLQAGGQPSDNSLITHTCCNESLRQVFLFPEHLGGNE